ncbi:MAG TPA: hypothetical protein VNK95_16580, partial [Caldilineaceae bacterium]|nr:hypothetical protein [Caldilineaceae bacterium]
VAVDPLQPEVVYVATGYLYGSSEVHEAPGMVAMSADSAQAWTPLVERMEVAVADLMPVAGMDGAVYALTTQSRTPLALGEAPVAAEVVVAPAAEDGLSATGLLAWIVAALAALALVFAVASDLRSRRLEPVRRLAPDVARSNR